jgi:hypothetical protein
MYTLWWQLQLLAVGVALCSSRETSSFIRELVFQLIAVTSGSLRIEVVCAGAPSGGRR